MPTTTLKVTGMSCEHCVKAVRTALEGVEGVRSANVDLQAGRAVVEHDDAGTDKAALENAVMDQGYTAAALP